MFELKDNRHIAADLSFFYVLKDKELQIFSHKHELKTKLQLPKGRYKMFHLNYEDK